MLNAARAHSRRGQASPPTWHPGSPFRQTLASSVPSLLTTPQTRMPTTLFLGDGEFHGAKFGQRSPRCGGQSFLCCRRPRAAWKSTFRPMLLKIRSVWLH